jgi:predicted nuclease of predicted toxin-antitoxin system
VKLLFDHHLSRKLVGRLADVFPASSHVAFHHLDQAEDSAIWNFARTHAYTIVTKDSDFNDLSTLRGLLRKSSGCGWATVPPRLPNVFFAAMRAGSSTLLRSQMMLS